MRTPILLFATLAAAAAMPAEGQPTKLDVQADRPWQHQSSGVKFPPMLAGLTRDRVMAFTANDTDVAATYRTADDSDEITIFLFRNVSGDVSLWFDRASTALRLAPGKYPNARSLGVRPFTPRGQAVPSGLMETFNVDQPFRSTALVLLPVNGFYAKIRGSSLTRDGASLEALLLSVASSFDWSSRQREAAAVAIADCPAPLPERQPAEQIATSADDRRMSAMIGGLLAQASVEQPAGDNIDFCREPGRFQAEYGIYRPANASDRYVMALGDAGRAIMVGDRTTAAILAEQGAKPRVSVTFVELDQTATFSEFATLPLPEQVLALVESSTALSVASTLGKKREIVVNSDGQ